MLPLMAGLLLSGAVTQQDEVVGKRPYEMDWANRTQDDNPPLVDFENLDGWTVECRNAQAAFARTREQQIWDQYVGKLTYRGEPGGGPEVRIVPPAPVPVPNAFDAVSVWVYGNNWGWSADPGTPQVAVSLLMADSRGAEFELYLYNVDWTEWYLLHRRLTPDQIQRVKSGATFKAIIVRGGTNPDDRTLFFDNLAAFTERLAPLTFEPRPERGIPMFPGQTTGTNTGPGTLPFPTRLETILPQNETTDFKTSVAEQGGAYVFTYEGSDGKLTYRLEPKTGTLGDFTARWEGRGGEIRPCVEGGVSLLVVGESAKTPATAEHLGTELRGAEVVSRWGLGVDGVSAEVTFTYRLWAKSLVVDIVSPGGNVAETTYGHAVGLDSPRLVQNPYYIYTYGNDRPSVAISGPPDAPLFLAGNTDWCLSNASIPAGANQITDAGVFYNGGTRYLPRTDGRRNDCYERFFITLSPLYDEVLPTIPNPVSPWKKVTGTGVWRAHGAGDRANDARYWTEVHRYGMTHIIVTDHETGWRDGGESFTFRTRTAPGKGGDQGQYDYARLMQDKLGFVYGPYNNYTDFAPVNEYWSYDLISRTPDLQLQHAWMRCYAPKPARAIEYASKLPYQIEEKFHFSTAYCDVHTAVAPWDRVDYDARVPGAGTFNAVFYAYGEIMLHQKRAWDGPVYSEGGHHFPYVGLTDGNYGQDSSARLGINPWLVDFDLRRMHDLCCNFGMGAPDMYWGRDLGLRTTKEEQDAAVDRFLAATVAFGHPGFLHMDGGMHNALRSYYMLQQLHSRYCLASAQEIRYLNADGRPVDTSEAVATDAWKRSQIVTRYSDGTVTVVNGNLTERMKVNAYGKDLDLPPNGYAGWTEPGDVWVLSSDRDGKRCDYAVTPEYIYVDGRGSFERFEKAASNGIGICRAIPDGGYEVIPYKGADCGFAIPATSARALDQAGGDIGPAELRTARGLTYVVPVEGAFSYMLQGATPPEAAALTCDRDNVVAGEVVTVQGREGHALTIPADAKEGERVWRQFEGQWIDFTVVPLTTMDIALDGNVLTVSTTSNLAQAVDGTLSVAGLTKSVRLESGVRAITKLDLGTPDREFAALWTFELAAGGMRQATERGMRVTLAPRPIAKLPDRYEAGIRLRGQGEQPGFGTTAANVYRQEYACGGVRKDSIAMHPPWMNAVGYTWALFEPLKLPADRPAAFRALVGKGDGSDPGDGILYKVAVIGEGGAQTVEAERTVTRHEWMPIEADLSAWAGETVRLKLIADPGAADNTNGDWGCWAEITIVSRDPELIRTLDEQSEAYAREPGPFAAAGITADELGSATAAWLHYDGQGLEGAGNYGSSAVINGVDIGPMAPAGGNETAGVWAENVTVPLTPEAIRALGLHNTFVLNNHGKDWFKVRRFWIEADLADGRKVSSDISTATYTQPPSWPYAEGILVPFEQSITAEIWFSS